jgi:lipopolysaccharide/colanic/teichoic acid biosynthesis glycosyltransferase
LSKLLSSRGGKRPRLSAFDLICAFAAPLLAILVRDETLFVREPVLLYWGVGFGVSVLTFVLFRSGAELTRYFSLEDGLRVAKVSIVVAALTAMIIFSLNRLEGVPRSVPLFHGIFLALLLIGGRTLRRVVHVRRTSRMRTKAPVTSILVVGTNDLAVAYLRLANDFGRATVRIAGILDLDGRKVGRTIAGRTIIGSLADADAAIAELAVHGVFVDQIIVATRAIAPESQPYKSLEAMAKKRAIPIKHVPAILGFGVEAASEKTSSAPVSPSLPAPEQQPRAALSRYLTVRRFVDASIALGALIVLAPVMLLVMLAVRVAFGSPVVFWQERLGRFGRSIHVHKFRSMRHPVDSGGRVLEHSERETRFGRMLRALRLDELPQLIDVVRGDLALVGPRPLLPVDQPADPSERLSVRPGITGWAQVHGGKVISPEEKNALDVWYIRNAGPLLDMRILWLTMRTVLRARDHRDKSAERAAAAALAMLEAERIARLATGAENSAAD